MSTSSWRSTARSLYKTYSSLSPSTRSFLHIYIIINLAITGLLLILGPQRIFNQLAIWGRSLEQAPYGWALILALIIATSFPPLIGYGTLLTVCGFAFGVWTGWLIAVAGCLVGATLSFVVCRLALKKFLPFLDSSPTFSALATAVRAKGTPLIILIRFCPFPFPYSNLFFASIESVSIAQFLLATLFITPKLLLHVFTGSRLMLLSDEAERLKMDTLTKFLNALYVILGSLLSIGTGWYVWRLTQRHVNSIVTIPTIEEEEEGLGAEREGLLDDEGRPYIGDASRSRVDLMDGHDKGNERWSDDFSDFGDEESKGIQLKRTTGKISIK